MSNQFTVVGQFSWIFRIETFILTSFVSVVKQNTTARAKCQHNNQYGLNTGTDRD